MRNLKKVILIYLLCLCSTYLSKENNAGISVSSSNNDCFKCKLLTQSFNTWLDKTSRGKFEGGDAAWEETKLKNYARSEVRLVEIQENLCSDLKMKHQDKCYALAEQVENIIENWWFLDHSESVELYSWLCIKKLEYCCPENHYGDKCEPCVTNDSNIVCSGHGKCDGEGTRQGNGSCICDTGFDGEICNKCATNYFVANDKCEQCSRACKGCNGRGPSACAECANGWISENGVCIDIDECKDMICKENEYCVNTKGSYICKHCDNRCVSCKGDGPSNCSLCRPNDILIYGRCIGKDEQWNIFIGVVMRCILYTSLLFMSIVVFKKSVRLCSILVIFSSIIIYLFETNYTVNSVFNKYIFG